MFGTAIGVTHSTLETIEKKCRGDPDECFPELLSMWLKSADNPTWQTILTALRSRTVDMNRLAKNIEERLEDTSKTQTVNGRF